MQLTITVEGSGAPDEIALPRAHQPRGGGRALPVDAGLDRERAHVAVPEPHLRPAAARGGEGRGGRGEGGRPGRPGHRDRGRGGERPAAPRRRGRTPSAWTPSATRSRRCSAGGGAAPRRRSSSWRRSPSRTRLRVGEPLVLTYWLVTQTSVADLQFKEAPQFAGLLGRGPRAAARLALRGGGDRGGRELPAVPDPAQAPLPDEGGDADPARHDLPHRPRPAGLLRRGGRRRARDEAGHDHGGSAAGRARLHGGGGPLPHVGEPRPRRGAARRGGDAALPGRGHRQPEVDRPRARGRGDGSEGLPPAGEERPAGDEPRGSPARARGSSWSCPRRAAPSRCPRSRSPGSTPRPGGS